MLRLPSALTLLCAVCASTTVPINAAAATPEPGKKVARKVANKAATTAKSETARLTALAQRVTILRDKWGIPHVYGKMPNHPAPTALPLPPPSASPAMRC